MMVAIKRLSHSSPCKRSIHRVQHELTASRVLISSLFVCLVVMWKTVTVLPSLLRNHHEIADHELLPESLALRRPMRYTKQQQQHSSTAAPARYVPHPPVVQYHFRTNTLTVLQTTIPKRLPILHINNKKEQNRIQRIYQDSSDDDSDDDCEPMHEWQTQSKILCNPLHEFDVLSDTLTGSFTFIACGGDRCAFKISAHHANDTDLVLKLRDIEHSFDETSYDRNRQDGMVMERLTSSPYVLSTFGFCGLSQIIEYGPNGSLYDLVEWLRGKGGKYTPLELPPVDRLRVGIQIVTSLADLHSFEEDHVASVTHNDFDTDQMVFVDGIYKLNDFHLSHFLKKHRKTGEVCHHPMRVSASLRKVHAPEESYYGTPVDNEKADDYIAGNLLYYVLTKKWIFEGITQKEGIKKLRNGERSPFPTLIQSSKDPADIAMMKAINMLWTHDVKKRPKAREVSDYMIRELETIVGKDNMAADGVIRVEIPPLPKGWDHNDDGPSWDENLRDDDKRGSSDESEGEESEHEESSSKR